MTDQHKAALAQGRVEGRAVRVYMEALQVQQPRKRGRPGKSSEEIHEELDTCDDPMLRLKLRAQLRFAMEQERGNEVDWESITNDFIKVVASYSERNNLSYHDWRDEGVPASVLKQAGMRRGG